MQGTSTCSRGGGGEGDEGGGREGGSNAQR